VLGGDPNEERVHHFVERAHEACFIANSLGSEITIEPDIQFASAATPRTGR